LQEKIAKTKQQLEEARLERKRLRKIWDEKFSLSNWRDLLNVA